MSEFHKEAKHKGFALLFESCKQQEKFKSKTDVKCFAIGEKEEKLITSMLLSSQEFHSTFVEQTATAIGIIAIARSQEELLLQYSGLITPKAQGIMVCMDCLQKCIELYQEHLLVLKDIESMAKQYADKL